MSITLFVIFLAIVSVHSEQECEVNTDTLCVNAVTEEGFGDVTNQYAFTMTSFNNELYVGTLNAIGGLPSMALFWLGFPFASNGAQIYKGTFNSISNEWSWDAVVTNGNGNPANYGIRKMAVVGDYIYAVTGNHISGFEVWRTSNGTTWQVIFENGFGDPENTSGRGLVTFKGYLYVGGENRQTGGHIWRRAIMENGQFVEQSVWERVVSDGFGDAQNYMFSDFVEYKDWLYVGTVNPTGMQLYRTLNGTDYQMIFDNGNGNVFEMAIMKLYVYNNKLYIGTTNYIEGASLYVNVDDDGMEFEAIFTEGNGNRLNFYMWYLQEYQNRLYVGTFNGFGEFDLFSAVDPENDEWVIETDDAFGYVGQYGVRSMTLFNGKLMIGSATGYGGLGCVIFEAIGAIDKDYDNDREKGVYRKEKRKGSKAYGYTDSVSIGLDYDMSEVNEWSSMEFLILNATVSVIVCVMVVGCCLCVYNVYWKCDGKQRYDMV